MKKILLKLKTKNSKLAYQTGRLKNKKGFTLLFAILVSILVLAVGSSMITIALKQLILSGTGRESQYAFYAANTGAECAIYWDLNGTELEDGVIKYVFPPEDSNPEERIDNFDDVKCGGGNIKSGSGFSSQDYTRSWETDASDGNPTTFYMVVDNGITDNDMNDLQYCAKVTVNKEKDTLRDVMITTITSQGLNTCDPDNNPRAVQRGLVWKYES